MKLRARELAHRRIELQARCDEQRAQLAAFGGDLQFQLRYIDRGIDLARRATARPMLLVIALAALAFVGPSGIMRWISRAMLIGTAIRHITVAEPRVT
jgi:hypothetical protein